MKELNKIPLEVQKVWLITGHSKYVGLEQYNEINAIIEKYPEYFPWEHTYKTIPQEVHNDYSKELEVLDQEYYPKPEILPGEGLYGYFKRMSAEQKVQKKPTKEMIKALFVDAPKKRLEYENKKKQLWNKHYKVYKLKYRD